VVPEWPPLSARAFAEDFYAWYAPRALGNDTVEGWNHTLKLIRWDLNDELANLLESDTAAQAKCRQLVGIDFDPFLYTQEPIDHHRVGRVLRIGPAYKAEVFRVVNGTPNDKPDVTAEFRKKDEHWVFLNFLYPSGSDLITILKSRKQCSNP
jgi:hypothetical protein